MNGKPRILAMFSAFCLSAQAQAQAQYRPQPVPSYPSQVRTAQPRYSPQPRIYQQQPQYAPTTPGGFVSGNPSPFDPNGVAQQQQGGSRYWDPQRGWVSHTQNTEVLNSANSPGRDTIMPGTSLQSYDYWDGTRWVRGTRWMGQDGLWHGEHTDTVVGPNGSSHENKTVYAPNPMAGRNAQGPAQPRTTGVRSMPPRAFGAQPAPSRGPGAYPSVPRGYATPR